jgi:hypothetical protein
MLRRFELGHHPLRGLHIVHCAAGYGVVSTSAPVFQKAASELQIFGLVYKGFYRLVRNVAIFFASFEISLVSHSQIVITFHPAFFSERKFRRSRLTFDSRLFDQNDSFVTGRTCPYLHVCMWKKHP